MEDNKELINENAQLRDELNSLKRKVNALTSGEPSTSELLYASTSKSDAMQISVIEPNKNGSPPFSVDRPIESNKRSQNRNKKGEFLCDICAKISTRSDNFKRHMKNVHNVD